MNSIKRFWTINGDFIGLDTGIARYAREVVQALDEMAAEGHILTTGLDLTLVAPREPRNLPLAATKLKIVPELAGPQFWLQAQLPWHVRGGLISFCNLSPVTIRRQIACIHDLRTFIMPENYERGVQLAHKLVFPLLGRQARYITTVSEHARDQLLQYRIARTEKLVVAYTGTDHSLRWDASRSALEYGVRPFALCLGHAQHYENLKLVVKIAPALDAIGLDIYIAGDVSEEALPLPPEGKPRNLRLLGRISDDDLAKALRGAVCFLFPSRSQGFPLPAMEAMLQGCPVVASTSPSMPEICGEGALYAGPDDPGAWIDAVRNLCGNETFRRKQGEKGRMRAQRFTWRRVADVYLQLMGLVDTDDRS